MKPEHAPLIPLMAGTVDGTAFSVHGAGEPLVLVHGVGMGKEIWAPQIAAFSQDYQVIAYDMLGHGDSALPAADVTLRDYADQLAGLLDHLGITAANVVGTRWGRWWRWNLPWLTRKGAAVVALNAVFMRTEAQRAAVLERAAALALPGRAPRWIQHWIAGLANRCRQRCSSRPAW
jgi:pimeloyl-ACP methyl ester carboxylesterase